MARAALAGELSIEGDDAAEGRSRIGAIGQLVGGGAVPATATPQGLACLTITQAGASNCRTHSSAVSLSAMLLYESSLPCNCVAARHRGADRARIGVERGALMRVLAVAQIKLLAKRQIQVVRERSATLPPMTPVK